MKVQPQLNVRKAALYSIVINALQIVAVLALAIYILSDGVNKALHGPWAILWYCYWRRWCPGAR